MQEFQQTLDRIENKIDRLADQYGTINTRVSILESRAAVKDDLITHSLRLQRLEDCKQSFTSKYEKWLDVGLKILATVVGAVLIFKLNKP